MQNAKYGNKQKLQIDTTTILHKDDGVSFFLLSNTTEPNIGQDTFMVIILRELHTDQFDNSVRHFSHYMLHMRAQ